MFGDLENPEQLPVLEVLKVTHATWLRRKVSNGFLDLENKNTKEIVKIHDTIISTSEYLSNRKLT